MPRVPVPRSSGRSWLYALSEPFRFTFVRDGTQQPAHGEPNAFPDLRRVWLRVDDGEPVRLRGREGEEAVANPAVEREIEPELEPRLIVGRLAAESDLRRQVEEDREVGPKPAGRDLFERTKRSKWNTGAVALVRKRRVGESGADDRRAGPDGRADHLLDQLPASGVEQQRVGERVVRSLAVVEEDVTEAFAEPGTARFTSLGHGNAVISKVRFESCGLAGLAGTLGPFDRDEPAANGRRGGGCHTSECSGGHPSRSGARTLGVMGRRLFSAAALALFCAAVPASVLAHPLGNFTINHYAGIVLAPGEIRLDVVIDMAEIPTFQERQHIDTDGDGDVTDAETAAAVGPACERQATDLNLAVDGVRSTLTGSAASITFPAGLGGLSTMRIECRYVAPLPSQLPRSTITFEDASYPERIGWREIVVTGVDVTIDAGGLPTTSVSARLTAYPTDLVAQPLDVRSATIIATPGPGAGAVASQAPTSAGTATDPAVPGAVPGGVGVELPAIFREVDLTPFVALLSIVTAFALGAGHALTPGHGKTLMAAYLVGTRGTPLHAVGLGLSVTVSHTLGILVLAALVVGAQGVLPPDVVVRVAPVVAAATIVALGGWMLLREVQRRVAGRRAAPPHDHDHGHAHDDHGHDHAPDPGEHSHGGVRHSHLPAGGSTISWRGLFALGLAGGLIPSTSALIILLGSIVAGRPAFGFVLVVVFGLGMAAVMSGVGLAMVFARERLDRLPAGSGLGRIARHAPLAAAVVVLAFGVYLTAQAIGGRPVF
jgi:nickel/cobalt transporter (NicO) family protein